MEKILVATVGSSCAPIINAVQRESYKHVFFVCSKGQGATSSEVVVDGLDKPCFNYLTKSMDPSIVAQTDLQPDQYTKLRIDNPDDLEECYRKLGELDREIQAKFGKNVHVRANYTGGTKTMGVALGLAAVNAKWTPEVNVGTRNDLIKVQVGDVPVTVHGWYMVDEDRLIRRVKQAARNFDYVLIAELSESFLKLDIPTDKIMHWNEVRNTALGFVAWDLFDHKTAYSYLQNLGQYFGPYLGPLSKIIELGNERLGYAMVLDLLNNAARKAMKGHYDDAVARLYRTTEMVGQIELAKALRASDDKGSKNKFDVPMTSVNPPLAILPEALQAEYRPFARGKDQVLLLGLRQTFNLLARLDNPAGKLFIERENQLVDKLSVRNNSILAHGITPVTADSYAGVNEIFAGFINEVMRQVNCTIKMPQLPDSLPML